MDHALPEPKENRVKEAATLEAQQQPSIPVTTTSSGNNEPSLGTTTGPNIVPGQRQRMITTTGQIREISDSSSQEQTAQEQQQQSSAEQYDHQQQHGNEYHQQVVQEGQSYGTYESQAHSNQVNASVHNLTEVKTVQIAHGRVPERDKGSNGHLSAAPTLYVVRENDELVYRAPNSVRYETERFQRYHPYQHHIPPSVKAEMEAQAHSQPPQHGQQIIYETETVETVASEASQQEAKYTNLEPMQNISSSQGYYLQPGYSSGSVTYLHGPSTKEEYYIQGSPNPVLYKSKY